MTLVRHVSIQNFRGIASLEWFPNPGINAIIGPGDTGKSTVLEALDLVLGARRSSFTDADFHKLDTSKPIIIDVTVGQLPKELLNLEAYIRFLRGYDDVFSWIVDEPEDGVEPAITLRLKVNGDCEPTWSLFTKRIDPEDLPRDVRLEHRALTSAQRLGASVSQHLAWGPRSVLTRLSDSKGGLTAILTSANRAARDKFDIEEAADLKPAIAAAQKIAKEMAVKGGLKATAALDARAVNVSNGAVALHADDIPLRALGTGSSRLMAAGLQAAAAAKVPILLLDEAEHGLEPHRIARLLHRLGSKEAKPIQQVFLTTHSPVVLRELSAGQLWFARLKPSATLELMGLGDLAVAQGLLRSHPEAFLSPTIMICEGPTEVGLCRGLDLWMISQGEGSLALHGIALVNGKGSDQWKTARGFLDLGFDVALFRDSDTVNVTSDAAFVASGGCVFCWDDGKAFEDQLFASIPLTSIPQLIAIAEKYRSPALIDQYLGSVGFTKAECQRVRDKPSDDDRSKLGQCARTCSWYKRTDIAEEVGRTVLGPQAGDLGGMLGSTLLSLAVWFSRNAPESDGNT